MRISRLLIEGFGKFHRTNVTCGPNLNMLSGANESGKTTIRRFLRAMLYGLERERGIRAKTDDYTKYQPWEFGKFQGSLEFVVEQVPYRLFRNFVTTAKECRLTNLATGAEIAEPEKFLRQAGLISEQAFCNTLWVGNTCAAGEELAEELHNYLANLALTGGANLDLSKALVKLQEQKRNLQKQFPEQELQELKQQLLSEQNVRARYQELLAQKQKGRESAGLAETNRKIYQREQDRILRLEQNKEELLAYLYEENLTEQLPVLEWESVQKEQTKRAEFLKKRAGQMLFLLAPGIVCLAVAFLLPPWNPALALAGGLTMLTGFACFALLRQRAKKVQKELRTWEEQVQQQTKAFLYRRLQLTQQEIARNIEAVQQLLPELEKNNFELERCEERLAEIERATERLAEVEAEYQRVSTECSAVDLTIQTLTELSGELYEEFGAKFGKALSEYAAAFTDGAYRKLAADENLRLQAVTSERTVAMQQVSYGTGEQFYLALRLAAADVFDPKKKLPLLLDDSFASFDEQRLESALVCLSGCGRQVFLFSSTSREERIAKRMGIAYEADFENSRTNTTISD